MGWKTLKERFGVHYIVSADSGFAYVGHAKQPTMATIDRQTGDVVKQEPQHFLENELPTLAYATSEERKAALDEPDRFSRDLPVFTVRRGEINTFHCEHHGFPNVTHSGSIMYPGVYTANHEEAVAWAKWELGYLKNRYTDELNDHLASIANGNTMDNEVSQDRTLELRQKAEEAGTNLNVLNQQYRHIEPHDADDDLQEANLSPGVR